MKDPHDVADPFYRPEIGGVHDDFLPVRRITSTWTILEPVVDDTHVDEIIDDFNVAFNVEFIDGFLAQIFRHCRYTVGFFDAEFDDAVK